MLRFKNQFLTLFVGTAFVLGAVGTSSASSIAGLGQGNAVNANIPSNKAEDANAVAALLNLGNAYWTSAGAKNSVAGLFSSQSSGRNTVMILPAWSALNHTGSIVIVLDRGQDTNWILHYTNQPSTAGPATNHPSDVTSGKAEKVVEAVGDSQPIVQHLESGAPVTSATTTTSVPEPSSLIELCTGLLIAAAICIQHRRRGGPQNISSSIG